MTRPFDKPFKTYKEQIEILKQRGMLFQDEDSAENYLKQINYYRLSGYWLSFELDHSTHQFKPNTKFENVLALYNFDRELRLCLLDAIERIEVSARTQLAYQMADKFGPHPHLQKDLAKDEKKWNKNYAKLRNQIRDRHDDEKFIQHHMKIYSEKLPPIWVVCEVMSLGLLSNWYRNLKTNSVRKAIAKEYNIYPVVFDSWLNHLKVVRNFAAHHARLWDRKFGIKVRIPDEGILKSELIMDSNRLYNSLVVMIYLMSIIAPESLWKSRLKNLLESNSDYLAQMGFPENWQSKEIWKQEKEQS